MLTYDVDDRRGISSSILYFKIDGGKNRYYFECDDTKRRKFQIVNVSVSIIFMFIFFYSSTFVGLSSNAIIQFCTFFLVWQVVHFLVPKKQFKGPVNTAKAIGFAPLLHMVEWSILYLAGALVFYQLFSMVHMIDTLPARMVLVFLLVFAILPYLEALYFFFTRTETYRS